MFLYVENDEKEIYTLIASNIRRLREAKGKTHKDFRLDVGIDIGRIERQTQRPSISTLLRICRYLETNVIEFFASLKESDSL